MKKKKDKRVLQIPNYIKKTAKTLSFFSDKLAAKFALDLFDRPIKFPMPEREKHMDISSTQYSYILPKCKKQINVYQYGNGSKKALLVHGWNGRGTQLVSIAKQLEKNDYTVYSFDAPGHGKTPNTRTVMIDFIEAINELSTKYKGFDIIIGHSLGGMSTLNAISRGAVARKAVTIGAGDKIQDIINDFVLQLGLKSNVGIHLKKLFEKKYSSKTADYDVYKNAEKINIPVLLIHDKNDKDVPYTTSENINNHLKNSDLLLTEKLGHKKILGNEDVIQKIISFANN